MPRGLVPLERLFNGNDVAVKGKVSNENVDTTKCNIDTQEELKSVTVLLSWLHHLLMIIDRRKELLSRKLLEWLSWKSDFT
jgi:hypothetical protein